MFRKKLKKQLKNPVFSTAKPIYFVWGLIFYFEDNCPPTKKIMSSGVRK
jgi:hypothetical protein